MTLHYASNLDYVWALLPEVILCAWGMVVLLAGVWNKDTADAGGSGDLGWLALAGVAAAAMANGWLHGVHEDGTGAMVAVDGFRLFANWIFLVGAVLGILVSLTYVDRQRL